MAEETKKQADYSLADWEVLEVECEDCEHTEYDVSDMDSEFFECAECEGTNLMYTWNYEEMNCSECGNYIEIEEEIYAKDDGEFEDVVCLDCFNEMK